MAKIIVIDDHAASREFLSDLLRSRGHTVSEAANGDEGLQLARRERPDLVFTDILMPTMDGFELARQVRADAELGATPLIFYTASYQGAEAQRLAETCGVARFLTKPSEAAVILAAVDEALLLPRQPSTVTTALDGFEQAHLRLVSDTLADKLAELERTTLHLREALARAEAADRLRMAFLDNMSHEIRTPLNVILGFAELLCAESGSESDSSREPFFEGIKRGSARLISTMQSVFDIAKLQSGTFDYRPTDLRLSSMIEQAVDELEPAAHGKKLALSVAIDEPDAVIRFDSYCLSRAFHHIVENAIKFTATGGVAIRLRRSASRELVIEVEDSGVGIDPDYQASLFQPFTQEERGYTRRFEGSGLGLALAQRFLELGNARISFESTKGRGTTFTIAFARASELQDSVPEPGSPSGTRPSARSAGSARAVLVVEDDADTQVFMQRVLRPRFRVLLAATGEEARAALTEHGAAIGLVLMDLSLKGREDGLELTRELKRHPKWRYARVIATTAHASSTDRERCLAAGCDAYLAKPFTRAQLFSLIDTIG